MRRRHFLARAGVLLSTLAGCESGPACWDCRGRGRITCTACNGEGFREVDGDEKECVVCNGEGDRKCSTCNGSGKAKITKT